MSYYLVTVATGTTETAYVKRNDQGLPVWTWRRPQPLTLEEAEHLAIHARTTCGGSLEIVPA